MCSAWNSGDQEYLEEGLRAVEVAAASLWCSCARQGNVHALQTDKWLAVRGSDSIFALGDAATIVQDRALEHAAELFVQVLL